MEKLKRNERIGIISHILTESPNQILTLGYFCQMLGAAKSTISEDIDLIRTCFTSFGLGDVETVAGAAGGVRYLPFPIAGGREFIESICQKLSSPQRILPGGYIYMNDILSSPKYTERFGRMLASQFYRYNPDFVLTVETKGIPLAMSTAAALGINCVVARRDQQPGMDWPYVSINYVSGSSGRLQTMSLSKRLVREGQKALIVDDFMKAGGTARGMMEMMREFAITVVGIGMLMSKETDVKKRVEGVKSLMVVREVSEEKGAVIEPGPWIK